MRSSTIKWVIVAVLAIFLLTTILTAIIAVREASSPFPSEPLSSNHNTTIPQSITGTINEEIINTGQTK